MKILIVNAMDSGGGAARAAYRLHSALINEGVDSQMLVQSKLSDDYKVIGPVSKWQKIQSKLMPYLDNLPVKKYKKRNHALFSTNWLGFSSVVEQINAIKPDIVHLHWVNYGMIKIEDLEKIKAPIIWSMHDNWLFTGGCHVMWECEKYKVSCGACPRLGSNNKNDLSHKSFLRKQKSLGKIKNLTVVGLSNWLADCARKSKLLKEYDVKCLPNPLNVSIYAPIEKYQARKLLRLPVDKKLILFGAIGATSDPNKGFNHLSSALSYIADESVELVVFGSSRPEQTAGFKHQVHYLGRLYDDISLRVLYSAADVMVVPSVQEAFGQTAVESMACKTPVVAFNATGLKDIVDHKVNGYLAKPYEPQDLADGIEWILNNTSYTELSSQARQKVVQEFDSKKVAAQYISLYQAKLKELN